MTNAEKFVEVFGTDLKRQYATKSWWDQEFVPLKTTGYWIRTTDDAGYPVWECDKCGWQQMIFNTDFCPNCGDAKIVEPQESEEISREEIAALLARESEE